MTHSHRAARRDGLVVVIGAGLAGLVAACTLLEHGHDVLVCERAKRPGGTTRLSAGWIWRYRQYAAYRELAPNGDPGLQQVIWEQLPAAIDWLAARAVKIEDRSTNPQTDGVRISPGACIDTLAGQLPAGALRTNTTVVAIQPAEPQDAARFMVELRSGTRTAYVHADHIVHAGGGFAANLGRVAAAADIAGTGHAWVRAAEGCDGSSIDIAAGNGAMVDEAGGEAYCRLMPAGIDRHTSDWSEDALPLADAGILVDVCGEVIERNSIDWADTLRAWELVRRGGTGWLLVPEHELDRQISHGTIRATIARAASRGAVVIGELGTPIVQASHVGVVSRVAPTTGVHRELAAAMNCDLSPAAAAAASAAAVAVAVDAGITHTMGGLRVDSHARVLGMHGSIPGFYAAGVDVGGISVGGYSSGLAQALVFGRRAGRCIDFE